MTNLEFFKNEAKKFLKDWRTQTQTVGSDGAISYHYDWMFYDVGDLFFYYELDDKDEQNIKLARAQHYIANMLGYKKWDNLIHASDTELELAEFLLRHFKNAQDVQGWQETLMFTGIEQYGEEAVLEYAKQYFPPLWPMDADPWGSRSSRNGHSQPQWRPPTAHLESPPVRLYFSGLQNHCRW